MTEDPRVQLLLDELLATDTTPEAVCTSCPELLPAVRKRWRKVRRLRADLDALFPPSDDASPPPHGPDLPQVPGYEVEAILGRGGMGIVYRARHLRLNRLVALKMLLAGAYATPQERARFQREAEAVATLQHPNIVQVHDVGDIEGRPFFTMEYVTNGSLAHKLAGAPQPARQAAQLMATLAGAVQAAHDHGIVHRDLKPANVLLAEDGTPKIADFGLARHVDGDPRLTMSDARVGTPSYMAPEQALGKLGIIGPSVDIYALGAILYEMLTGRPPFRAETTIETERQVITVEAVPPSRLNANVPRDLETICLKCLHKDPGRRYASAAELAEDIHRFQDGQPIRARPVGWLERAWRWRTRNRGVAAALSGVALLVTLIVVRSLWAAAHFRELEGQARKLAREKGNLADEKGRLAVDKEREREKAVEAERREAGLRRQSDAQGKELRRNLYLTEMNLAGQAASVPSGLGRVNELLARWGQERPDLRNWEWYYLNSLCHRSLLTLMAHIQTAYYVAWSPNGSRLASAGADRTICIWDALDERPPLRLKGHTRDVIALAWSPDGQRIASASWDSSVRVWDTATGAELFSFPGHQAEVFSVAWSPDGKALASGGGDQTIQIWDAVDGASRSVLRGHEDIVSGLAWSPDSQRLASACRDKTVRVWDVAAGMSTRILGGHINWVNQVAWSPDGSRLASTSNDQTLRIWEAESGQELLILRGHTLGVASVAWSPDGARLASCSDDQTVKVWSAVTGTLAFSLRGHTSSVSAVAWSTKGDRLASAGIDGLVKVWDASTGPETPALSGHEFQVEALAWCQRQPTLCASADAAGVVQVWDMASRAIRRTLRPDDSFVHSLAWHPTGTRLATASRNGLIRIWDITSHAEPEVLDAEAGEVFSVDWSPDGRRLASGGIDRTVRIWDAISGQVSRVMQNHQHSVYGVAWSPDGLRLASASGDRTVKVWNAATAEEVLSFRGHTSEVLTVSWSPDGTRMASAGYDQSVQLWDTATAERTMILRGHTAHIPQVAWSPDGMRLASAGLDDTVKVWDTETGKQALSMDSPASHVNAVAWSPDGMVLAFAGEDRQIRIHDATAGYSAARAPRLLPTIDRRLSANSIQPADWRIRAEIHAREQEWNEAADDMRQYLLLKPHPAWFVLDGVVAGPYPEDLTLPCPPEEDDFIGARVHDADDLGSPSKVNWKVVPDSAQGIVDFGLLLEHRDHVSAYALFPIYSLDDQQVAILLGTDDQAQLWLNGARLYESLRSRAAVPDEDAVAGTSKAGWNTLLVRVANETGDHALYLRLSDAAADMARISGSSK